MEKSKDYRLDSRTKEQFAADIKAATAQEKILMGLYVEWLNKTKGGGKTPYSFTDNGVDNSGEYLEPGTAHAAADFILHKKGGRDKKIEIKFSRTVSNSNFHLKVAQMERYIREDVCIINFMGVTPPDCRFCILTPASLKEALVSGERKRFWHKDCIRFKTSGQKWYSV